MDPLISTQKQKLEQKKAQIQQAENLLKVKERKARVRHLIAVGGLVAKAELDHLPADILLGACFHLKEIIKKESSIVDSWKTTGANIFAEQAKDKTPIILKLDLKPEQSIRNLIRAQGLKWNALRKEWYGYAENLAELKQQLAGLKFSLEVLKM